MAGFSIPPLRAYAFKLYPTYPSGAILNSENGTLNADTVFRTQATDFTASYGVNTTPDTDRSADGYYFTTNAGQGSRQANFLTQSPISDAVTFDRALNFTPTGLSSGTIPTTAPDSPSLYQDYLDFLEISDLNMAQLLALPEFQLRNVGMGLRVTTDGFGHADNVQIDLSTLGIDRTKGVLDNAYAALTNREKILLQAALRNNPAASIALDNLLGLRTGQGQPTNSPFAPNTLGSAAALDRNPVLNKLALLYDRLNEDRRQTPSIDLDRESARQAAANRAGYAVFLKPVTQANLVKLTEKTAQAEVRPVEIPKLDGKVQPDFHSRAGNTLQEVLSGVLNTNANHPQLVGAEDSLSKKSGNSLSFQLGSGSAGTDSNLMQSGTGSGSGGQMGGYNPFSQQFSQQAKKRQALAYMA